MTFSLELDKLANGQKHTEDNSQPILSSNIQQAVDNFELARKIKEKVLNQELGIPVGNWIKNTTATMKEKTVPVNLTSAQRNKLKVLSSEFGIDVIKNDMKIDRVLTIAQVNRNKVLGHDECFIPNYGDKLLDNASFVNRNLKNVNNIGKLFL